MILVAGRLPEYDLDDLVDDHRALERVLEIARTASPAVRRFRENSTVSDRERFAMLEAHHFDGATIGEAGLEQRGITGATARVHIDAALRILRARLKTS
jgi:hypothetical protein